MGPYEQIAQIQDPALRVACVQVVNDWARELYEASNGRFIMLLPLSCQTPGEAAAEIRRVAEFGLPTGVVFDWVGAPEPVLHQMWEPVWAAAAETGLPINLHANPRGGSHQLGVGVAGVAQRNQSLMRVVNFPMGPMAELMSAVVFAGICDRHPGLRFVLEEAGVGWVPFLFWRFDREYEWGDPSARVFEPDIPLSDKPTEFVKRQVFFTFEVEEEGGFRRVPEVGLRNFLWASDFPGMDSPWPHSKAMGHTPVEAALGKEALNQLVFDNAVICTRFRSHCLKSVRAPNTKEVVCQRWMGVATGCCPSKAYSCSSSDLAHHRRENAWAGRLPHRPGPPRRRAV